MKLEVYNSKGEKTSRSITLPASVFGAEPNDHAIYLDVKQFLANQRQGTHKAKQRNEIHGSTRKLHRQKGTGGSRKGSIKNPLFHGGGRIFGPQPRDYSFKLNKKVKQLARISALAYKAKANAITVLEDFSFDAPKTKNYVELLSGLNMYGNKTLHVIPNNDKNVILSARNIREAKITSANALNTYDIVNAKNLLISESSLKTIESILSETTEEAAPKKEKKTTLAKAKTTTKKEIH